MTKSIIAFIPARSGSKRIPDKNIKDFCGQPLIAYSITSAINSGIFSKIICVTDSHKYAEIANFYGAEVPSLRPLEISGDVSPDIDWVKWALKLTQLNSTCYDAYAILRPTNPFRSPESIHSAWTALQKYNGATSIRAVEKCQQHPGKMWQKHGDLIEPFWPEKIDGVPFHSNQTSKLPEVFVQNASLEMAWIEMTMKTNSISGDTVIPYFSRNYEGFDINHQIDLIVGEKLVQEKLALLPEVNKKYCDLT